MLVAICPNARRVAVSGSGHGDPEHPNNATDARVGLAGREEVGGVHPRRVKDTSALSVVVLYAGLAWKISVEETR